MNQEWYLIGRFQVEFSQNVAARLDSVDGKPICVVDVSKSSGAAYVSGSKGSEFYLRVGNTTRFLDPQETYTLGFVVMAVAAITGKWPL